MNLSRCIAYAIMAAALCLISLIAAHAAVAGAGNDAWKPVDPAHLALKTSTAEKDADAEALFWDVYLEKSEGRAELRHYVRIKLFNQRGCDARGKVELFYAGKDSIADIAGRTIKPDGSIIELSPTAIFDRNVIKVGKRKASAKSFAMPGVEPGAIIEYRWREVRKEAWMMALHFQFEIPAQSIQFTIKDKSGMTRMKPMNMKDVLFKEVSAGLTTAQRANVPAFRREPQMPPENEVRGWMLVYTASGWAEYNYWTYRSQQLYEEYKSQIKPNEEVKKAAESLVAGAMTPEQKLERLHDFCRTKIKNIDDDSSLSEQAQAKIGETKNPAETLRRASGTGMQINALFAAMANAIGFEARVALTGDREESFPDIGSPFTANMNSYHVAVRVGGEWRFCDPSLTYLPFGMLRWQEEGLDSLISDPVTRNFVKTPISAPGLSKKVRKADFKLNDDGSLEGDVRIEYTGQAGLERKELLADMSAEVREKQVRDAIKTWLPTAEITNMKFENVSDPLHPMVQSYHVRVPDYAQRTSKRLLLQPAFFQFGSKPMFPNQERRHPVYFHYPWSEEDFVSIQLPDGFEPENFAQLLPLRAETISAYKPLIVYNVQTRTLTYQRSFFFGAGGALIFPRQGSPEVIQNYYTQLKMLFDVLHDRDSFTVSLKTTAIASR
jgi:hypothetical protein